MMIKLMAGREEEELRETSWMQWRRTCRGRRAAEEKKRLVASTLHLPESSGLVLVTSHSLAPVRSFPPLFKFWVLCFCLCRVRLKELGVFAAWVPWR